MLSYRLGNLKRNKWWFRKGLGSNFKRKRNFTRKREKKNKKIKKALKQIKKNPRKFKIKFLKCIKQWK